MAEKDLAEKKLEDYGDVFADIYNTLLLESNYLFRNSYLQDRQSRYINQQKTNGKSNVEIR